jgi:putative membrane protein insertion efficiency factor
VAGNNVSTVIFIGVFYYNRAMKKVLIKIVTIYQVANQTINPAKNSCRFTPSCSAYTIQAIEKYGALKGSYLGFLRILRCNPLFKPGHDPLK